MDKGFGKLLRTLSLIHNIYLCGMTCLPRKDGRMTQAARMDPKPQAVLRRVRSEKYSSTLGLLESKEPQNRGRSIKYRLTSLNAGENTSSTVAACIFTL